MDKSKHNHSKRTSHSATENHMNLVLPAIPNATGYIIYGIAPIPVRVRAGENVRVEPTSDGYNLWEVSK